MSRKDAPFSLWGALFLLLPLAVAAETPCVSDHYDEQVTLEKVYDGDTLRLSDGRKVRLIGINTPEKARDGQPAQAFAEEATRRLAELIQPGERFWLRYGQQQRDRYGRLLAHPFLRDDRNVTALLLRQGMGAHVTIAPNVWGVACYRQQEQAARQERLGVWTTALFQPIESRQVERQHGGFRQVTGHVTRVGQSKKAIWINLQGRVALRIPRTALEYFAGIELNDLAGKTITARGWLFPGSRGDMLMTISHPASLQWDK